MKNLNVMGEFYLPQEIESRYDELAEVYIQAFRGTPWYEVSQCPSKNELSCPGGLSPIEIGDTCNNCGLCPSAPAYTVEGLVEKFKWLGQNKEIRWYIEELSGRIALGAFAWLGTSQQLAEEKYADTPDMTGWLKMTIGNEPVVWLDEIFADKRVRSDGNLTNFEAMNNQFCTLLDKPGFAYRTITPQMIAAGRKSGLLICEPNLSSNPQNGEVPDRRYFATNMRREK